MSVGLLWLAQVAPALADSISGTNPVLTPVGAAEEMNLWSMAVKGGWIMIVTDEKGEKKGACGRRQFCV